MSLQNCCRLPYLINVFGQDLFDLLYARMPQLMVIQLVLSYLPDPNLKRKYRTVLFEISCPDDIIVYCYEHRPGGHITWTWDNRWNVADYLMDEYPFPNDVWEKFRRCRFVYNEDTLLQLDDVKWSIEELTRMEMEEEEAFNDNTSLSV